MVIVESPAKAKTINKYLGPKYVVKASMGHVRDLPQRAFGVDLEKHFEPTYRILPTRKKVVEDLQRAAKNGAAVYLATDLDREGEAIAWHLVQALNLRESRAKRVIFNEITKQAIQNAFKNAHGIDMDKVNAQQARRILDRVVGYQLSPLLWKKIAKNLSAGRVQSVAVRIVVDRESQIEVFVPDEDWNVTVILGGGQDVRKAQAAYVAYETHCEEQAKAKAGKAGEHDASPATGGELLKHPKTGELLLVVDTADPSLFRVRTEPGGECQIGRKAAGKGDAKAAKAPEWTRQPSLQIKPDIKKLKSILEKHHLFKANLVQLDGKPFRTSTSKDARPIERALADATYTITSLATKDKLERPSPPFTTASLQQQASTRLNFTTKRTMVTAQQLYEGVELGAEGSVALITYMRTDSTHLAMDAIKAVRGLIRDDFGREYCPDKPKFYASQATAQEAHEAIRPTDVNRRPEQLKPFLSADQLKLYDLIWRRFVACQMNPATWHVTEAMITAEMADHTGVFKATGRILAFSGFLAVLPSRLDGADALLPGLEQGQALDALRVQATQHFTQPPARYNEASLVRALESEGIGRPSTYAAIVSTIQDRGYVQKDEKKFLPTDLGKIVTEQLVAHFPRIMDVKFTSHMEEQLDKIEEAHLDWVAVLNEFYEPFSEALEQAKDNMTKQIIESEYTCEKCEKPMIYRWTKTGRFLACSGYPECKYATSVDDDGKPVKNEAKVTDHSCPKCEKPMIFRESRYGPFLGCSGYPECKTTLPCDKEGTPLKRVKPDAIEKPCPECAKPLKAKKGRGRKGGFLACTGYPACKHTEPIPDDIAIDWPTPKESDVKCPKCSQPMLIRHSRRGPFLGCKGFPKCRSTMSIPKTGDHVKGDDKKGQTGDSGSH